MVRRSGFKVNRSKIRNKLYKKQNGLCYYCNVSVTLSKKNEPGYPNQGTIDHVIPRSKGGTNDIKNLVLACYQCNHLKDNKTYHCLDLKGR